MSDPMTYLIELVIYPLVPLSLLACVSFFRGLHGYFKLDRVFYTVRFRTHVFESMLAHKY
jgi:hypothetical protein